MKALILLMAVVLVGCGKKEEPELSTKKVITPNEAANKLFVRELSYSTEDGFMPAPTYH